MTAPAPTVRQTPSGRKLKDGYATLITCALDPDIEFWEKEVTPPGFDGGDAIDQTTFHNDEFRTKSPRSLLDMTDSQATVAYDPAVLTSIRNIALRETTWTWRFSDGTTWAAYGFLRVFKPLACTEGEQPEAEIEITPSNYDNTANVEAGPALASVSGT